MNAITQYAKTLIGVSLISGIISVIAPVGSNSKVFRLVSGLFVIVCLAAPFKETVADLKNFSFRFENEYSFSDTENYAVELIENEMKSQLNSCVKQVIGTAAKDISVTVEKADGNIKITCAEIILSEEYAHKAKAVEELIFSRFGISPTVIT